MPVMKSPDDYLEDLRKIASMRKGKVLSGTYKTAKTKLQFQCHLGHIWSATPDHIKRGRWCPDCNVGLGERLAKVIFESIFERNFVKVRPDWLRNDRGNRMELDGFCEELGLAFEYQGEQHFSVRTPFIRTSKKLKQRQKDDERKMELCKENKITLVLIPDFCERFDVTEMRNFIVEECERLGVVLSDIQKKIDVDVISAYRASEELYKELQAVCEAKGGRCLSPHYITALTKLEFECKNGHHWKATPNKIVKQGSWCRECGFESAANSRRTPIEDLQAIAKSRNGKLISESFDSQRQKLIWECNKGHQWPAELSNIRNGTWCPTCRINTIEAVIEKVEQRDGKIILCESPSGKSAITVECTNHHIWTTKVRKIMEGHWCRECANLASKKNYGNGIAKATSLGKKYGLTLLAQTYDRNTTPMKWGCEHGHVILSSYAAVSHGKGCTVCNKEKRANEALNRCQGYAAKKGGKCLSPAYLGTHAKLKWCCQNGHTFTSTPTSVQSGSWCRKCHIEQKNQTKKN